MPKKYCDDCTVTHTPLMCWMKPRGRIPFASKKTEQAEIDAKYAWFEANPPDKYGHWICYLQIDPRCPKILTRETIVQEHVKPKGKYRSLKYDITNRKPACTFCNGLKGGQSLEKLAETYPQLRRFL